MKALIYTYQGEEFYGEIGPELRLFLEGISIRTSAGKTWPVEPSTLGSSSVWTNWSSMELEDGRRIVMQTKDIRAIITDPREDAPVSGDPTSSDDAPPPSEPPSTSSAPEGT